VGTTATSEHKEAAQLYEERERRIKDAIALRVPDRVPVAFSMNFWHARYGGRTVRDVMYDYDLNAELTCRAAVELQPDGVASPFTITAVGPLLEASHYQQLRWPGHGAADNCSYQYIDRELMKGDEYDLFIEDPTYFLLTRFLPRVSEVAEPLAKLPQFPSGQNLRLLASLRFLADPDVMQALTRLSKAGAEAQRMMEKALAHFQQLTALGFPSVAAGTCAAPYDYFADFMRGSKGIMLDLYRRKDKLLAAMEHIVPMTIRSAVAMGKAGKCNIIFMPLHWGLDGFMSLEQFKTLFWPQLRAVMMGMIEQDVVPCVFWEGNCTSRLEIIADIPRGKAIYWFEATDIYRAKEVLGDIACLRGNVPASVLNTGTPDDVTEYCKRLIKVVGKNGGFILDGAAAGIPDEAPLANVLAMMRTAREYGSYQ
jgi:hypothetical protein